MAIKLQNYEEVDFVVTRDMKDGTKRYSIPIAIREDAVEQAINVNDPNGDTFIVKRTTSVKEEIVKRVTETRIPEEY